MSNQDFDVYLARASNLSQRYRDEATEKPGPALDSAILTASRRAPVPMETIHPQSWFKRWRVPLSVAAVMMLGIGVTLRTVLEESKYSGSSPASAPVPVAAPAKPAAPQGASESNAGVVMDGAEGSADEEAAKTGAGIAEKKEFALETEKEIAIDDLSTPAVQAAPPPVAQDKPPQAMPSPEPSMGAAPSQRAVESQVGRASSGGDSGKSQSNPPQEQDAIPDSPTPPMPKREDDSLARQREEAPSGAVESEARVVPGIATPATEGQPQAFPEDGPRLPEGHRPIVDGKTYRSKKAQADNVATERKQSARAESHEDSPEAWLRHVAELRRLGRADEANQELERFRKRYPDYPAPTEQ